MLFCEKRMLFVCEDLILLFDALLDVTHIVVSNTHISFIICMLLLLGSFI
jgi:hypothetical protein